MPFQGEKCFDLALWIKQALIKLIMNKMNANQIAQRNYYCCCLSKLLIIVPLVVGGPTFL